MSPCLLYQTLRKDVNPLLQKYALCYLPRIGYFILVSKIGHFTKFVGTLAFSYTTRFLDTFICKYFHIRPWDVHSINKKKRHKVSILSIHFVILNCFNMYWTWFLRFKIFLAGKWDLYAQHDVGNLINCSIGEEVWILRILMTSLVGSLVIWSGFPNHLCL